MSTNNTNKRREPEDANDVNRNNDDEDDTNNNKKAAVFNDADDADDDDDIVMEKEIEHEFEQFNSEEILEEEVYVQDVGKISDSVKQVEQEKKSWNRKPLERAIDAQSDSVLFQQLDIDYIIGQPHDMLGQERKQKGQAAILRMFGVTEDGHSVCVHVHGFNPYFYCSVPEQFQEEHVGSFLMSLNAQMIAHQRSSNQARTFALDAHLILDKQSLMNFQPNGKKGRFLRIIMLLPQQISQARGILENGIHVDQLHQSALTFPTFESNILYTLRFMVDRAVVGGNWLELPAKNYRVRPQQRKASYCQIECDVMYDRFISHAAEGRYSKLAPFRILSVDIECAGRKGFFPDAEQDPVIQIATMVTEQGSDSPIIKAIWTLDTCAPIVGSEVKSFQDERELLRDWGKFMRAVDPDMLIGYNIVNFDFPYLIKRAQTLGVQDFPYWGRIIGKQLTIKDTTFSSKAYGTRESKEITIEGRVQFDMLQAIQRDYKLSSYSLNSVSAHFLGEQKEDVHHSAISELQAGTSETRRRLAVYCLKDAYLPQRLLDKLMYTYNYIEMSRVTGVPLSFLLARGQSIKVMSQLLRKARQRGLLIPARRDRGNGPNAQMEGEVAYEGATVLDAKAGYYELPIATLDFASLYPSIMMAHNLCYCTLVKSQDVSSLAPEIYTKAPTGDVFVKSTQIKGILPEILEELLSARKRAKQDLKNATDPLERAVLDGRQLALKISANSVYGFTGATVGQLPCLEISASTTAYGRQMIDHTKKLVEEKYTTANGYEGDAEVIYGDTDSVMIKFNCKELRTSMEYGLEAADYVSATFVKPIKLEFEKCYWPYLLISKKRYAGLLWENADKWTKMDTKGIETVRRDNCLLVRQVVETCLTKILINRDIPGAVKYVQNTISELLLNKLDLSLLVITKGLTKTADEYAVKAAHAELAQRMFQRDPATAPVVGDRVAYVMIKGTKNAKGYEKSECPIYAMDNNLPIDHKHYLDNFLTKPLLRLFEPMLQNAASILLSGEHTRSIALPTPSSTLAGGIMRFAKVRPSCVGCRAPIADEKLSKSLCKHCIEDEQKHLQKAIVAVNSLEKDFNRLWTQCQRCQGSLHQDVLCTSRDCPIFYRRRKVQKDLVEATTTLKRFDW